MTEWVKNKKELLRSRPTPLLKLRKTTIDLINTAIEKSQPDHTIRDNVAVKKNSLLIGSTSSNLNEIESVYVVGFGKASYTMAKVMEEILGDRIRYGVVSTKFGYGGKLKKIKVVEASHPIPSIEGLKAAQEITKVVKSATERDLILFLVSGGGSALAPFPPPGIISLSDKQKANSLLLASGASIEEINAVRKHISLIKGGRFAELSYPAKVISLIISDVVGDRLDTISSGPTVPDNTTFKDAYRVIEKYSLLDKMPHSVIEHIKEGFDGRIPDTPKEGNECFNNVQNIILLNNFSVLKAIETEAKSLGFNTMILSSEIEGESIDVGKVLSGISREVIKTGHPIKPPAVIISGGETTATLNDSTGCGGPNQECAVGFGMNTPIETELVFAAIDSDGTDGPTDFAGGIVDSMSREIWLKSGIDIDREINNHNTSEILKVSHDLIITGSTGTNVNDIRILLVSKTQNPKGDVNDE